jgi:hypothetical protein
VKVNARWSSRCRASAALANQTIPAVIDRRYRRKAAT